MDSIFMQLLKACLEENLRAVSNLLKLSPNVVNTVNENGWSALHYAAANGLLKSVEILHAHRATINLKAKDDATPLHLAALNNHFKVVSKLLELSPEIVDTKAVSGESALHLAAMKGHVIVVEILCKHKATINLKANGGLTPLHVAAMHGNSKVVSKLLKLSPNVVNTVNENGESALHRAARKGHVNVVEVLLKHKATVNLKANECVTPLHLAAMHGYSEVVSKLLELSPEIVDTKAVNGRSALHLAAQNGHVNVVEILHAHKATITLKSKKGITPLLLAAENGHPEVVSKLLKLSPEIVDTVEEKKISALHLAARSGNVVVVEILLEHGASVMAKDRGGYTPIHWACIQGHHEIVKRLLERLPTNDEMFLERILCKLLKFTMIKQWPTIKEEKQWLTIKVLLQFGDRVNLTSSETVASCEVPMKVLVPDEINFKRRLKYFLACLFNKEPGLSARWVWSKLNVNTSNWYVNPETGFDEDDSIIFYLRINKRRAAIPEMRESVENLNDLIGEVMKCSSDVMPFIYERLKELEITVLQDEIVDLLLRRGYKVDEENISKFQANTTPVTINVTSKSGTPNQYAALIFFSTCEQEGNQLCDTHRKQLFQVAHPNMMGCKEFIEGNLGQYLIIILHSGASSCYISLENKIAMSNGYLSQDCILKIFKQVVQGLAHLHNQNIIHCSIKPSNIFIDELYCTRIGDLTSAIRIDDNLSSASLHSLQTVALDDIYSPPDTNETIGVSSDIYSLGCVLFKMITLADYQPQSNELTLWKESAKQHYEENFIEEIFKLMERMIILEEGQRIPADQILEHQILKNTEVPSVESTFHGSENKNVIGKGGCGEVRLDDGFAVKEAHPGFEEVLENEKEFLFYLEAHREGIENVVEINKDCLRRPFIQMEIGEKGSLKEIISSQGQNHFTMRSILLYAFQITIAVHHCHGLHILHRDIKPANFVVTSKEIVKIIDFGLSVMVSPDTKCTGRVGTPEYMAPEVDLCTGYDKSADIYSLGAVFYELMTLRSAYMDKQGTRFEEFKLQKCCQNCSNEIISLIVCMMDDDPKSRPTIREVKEKLCDILKDHLPSLEPMDHTVLYHIMTGYMKQKVL